MAEQNIHDILNYAHVGKVLVEEAAKVVQYWETTTPDQMPSTRYFDLKTAQTNLELAKHSGVVGNKNETV